MKNISMLTIAIGCCALMTRAQDLPSYIKQGNQQFELKNYYAAAQFYEKYLETEKKRTPQMAFYGIQKNSKRTKGARNDVMFKLAESYRLVHDYQHAEKWYQEAGKYSTNPGVRYWQAVCQRSNEKFQASTALLIKLKADRKLSGQLKAATDRELDNLKFIDSEMNKTMKDYTVDRISDSMHTQSYALAVKKNDTMVFTAISKQDLTKEGNNQPAYTNHLFTTEAGFNFVNRGREVVNETNDGINEGMACFSADGKRMYFTRWYKKDSVIHSSVYVSLMKENGEWGSPEIMDDKINMPDYNAAQPFITDDGKHLLFASNRPGGAGKYDLWDAGLDAKGNVLSVENMGPVINTAEEEFSPYFHSNSNSLVFSSNGRTGMGGFDIYSSHGNINSSQWEAPVNPGSPLNSPKDDLFFISTDKTSCFNTGYISSDRGAEENRLSIYAVKQNNGLQVNGLVIDSGTKQPLAGVIVRALDTRNGNQELQSVVTDDQGRYRFIIRNISEFDVKVEKDNYSQGINHISHQLNAGEHSLQNEIIGITSTLPPADSVVDEITILGSKNTYVGSFEFAKSSLSSISYDNLDSLASLMKKYPGEKVQLGGYTDGIGSDIFNLKLAQKRADACIKYLVKKGISKDRLVSKAFGKCCPLQEEKTIDGKDNKEARKNNRRVEYIFLPE